MPNNGAATCWARPAALAQPTQTKQHWSLLRCSWASPSRASSALQRRRSPERRNADQAEQRASSLQAQAQDAQAAAVRAQENARSLKVQSSQAQGDALSARQGLAALDSLGEVQTALGGLRDQISAVLNPAIDSSGAVVANNESATVALPSPLAPIVNLFGQATGTLLNVTA